MPKTNACGEKQGTRAGYMRHRRANQDACPECKKANAQTKRAREISKKVAISGKISAAMAVLTPPNEIPNQIQDAKENYAMVATAMNFCTPARLADLSKRRQELVDYMHEINELGKESNEPSLQEQLRQARARRTIA